MTLPAPSATAASSALVIRRASAQDLAMVVGLRAALRREEQALAGAGLVPEESGGALRDLTRRQLADAAQGWFVATLGDEVCGILRCAITRRDGVARYGVLTTAYVSPACRQRGALRALVGAAADWAGARGVSDLRVRTNTGNATANAAWEALGFVPAQVIRRRVHP